MSACRLIVCERTSHWAAALRAALGEHPPRLVEARSVTQCETLLDEAPASLVAVELTPAGIEPTCRLLARGSRWPEARFVILLTSEIAAAQTLVHEVEALVREAGAIDVARSLLDVPRVAQQARRLNRLTPSHLASASKPPLQELAYGRMPWSAWATAAG